jgi:hypothetical protein
MREALNENPMVQAVVVAVLLLAAAVLLLTQLKGSDPASAPEASSSAAVTTADGTTGQISASTSGNTTSVSATVTTPPGGTTGSVSAPAAVPTGPFAPGPGVPRSLVADHDAGKTVVLYIYDKKGLEDGPVRHAVEGLRGDSKVSVYMTSAQGITRYAGITQGVGVNQVPALVVVSPHNVGGTPRATVSYGFRGNGSVEQAVRDAVYKGRTLGYDPG